MYTKKYHTDTLNKFKKLYAIIEEDTNKIIFRSLDKKLTEDICWFLNNRYHLPAFERYCCLLKTFSKK